MHCSRRLPAIATALAIGAWAPWIAQAGTPEGHAAEEARVVEYLRSEGRPHFAAFLEAWGRS